jgi:hypothetical protein
LDVGGGLVFGVGVDGVGGVGNGGVDSVGGDGVVSWLPDEGVWCWCRWGLAVGRWWWDGVGGVVDGAISSMVDSFDVDVVASSR